MKTGAKQCRCSLSFYQCCLNSKRTVARSDYFMPLSNCVILSIYVLWTVVINNWLCQWAIQLFAYVKSMFYSKTSGKHPNRKTSKSYMAWSLRLWLMNCHTKRWQFIRQTWTSMSCCSVSKQLAIRGTYTAFTILLFLLMLCHIRQCNSTLIIS